MALVEDLDALRRRAERSPGDSDLWGALLTASARAGKVREDVELVARCLTRAGATPERERRFLALLARADFCLGDPRFQFVHSPRGHTFGHVTLSPRGRWLAVLALPRRLDLLEGEGFSRVARLALPEIPGEIRFSDDEQELHLGYPGRAGGYDLEIRELPGGDLAARHELASTSFDRVLATDHDGRGVLAARGSTLVRVAPASGGAAELLATLDGPPRWARPSPDGRLALVATRVDPGDGGDAAHLGVGTVLTEVVDLAGGGNLAELHAGRRILEWEWSPDGDHVLALEPHPEGGDELVVLAVPGGAPLSRTRIPRSRDDRSGWAAYACGGKVAVVGHRSRVLALAPATGEVLWEHRFEQPLSRLFAASARGDRLSVAHPHAFEVRDAPTGRVRIQPVDAPGRVRRVMVGTSGQRALALAEGGRSTLYDLATGARLGSFPGEDLFPAPELDRALRWSPGRGLELVGLPELEARRRVPEVGEEEEPPRVAFCPGGDTVLLVPWSAPRHLTEVALEDGRPVWSGNPFAAAILDFGAGTRTGVRYALGALEEGGTRLHIRRADGTVDVVDLPARPPYGVFAYVREHPRRSSLVVALPPNLYEVGIDDLGVDRLPDLPGDTDAWALDPVAEEVAVYARDDRLRVLSLRSGALLVERTPELGVVRDLAYTPDGRQLVYAQAGHARLMVRREPG